MILWYLLKALLLGVVKTKEDLPAAEGEFQIPELKTQEPVKQVKGN